jgi:AhpD family alkylhydroperoxidase
MQPNPSSARLDAALREVAPPLSPREALLCTALGALAVSHRELLETCLEAARGAGVPRSQIEELLLQGALFGGFPRTVDAFQLLQRRWGRDEPTETVAPPPPGAGAALFDAIYAELAPTVREELRALHPELARWIDEHAYGAVLARGGLDAATRELAAVTALAASDCRRQLLSHARGAVRCGADEERVRAALRLAGLFRAPAELAEMAAQVDRALVAVRGHGGGPSGSRRT